MRNAKNVRLEHISREFVSPDKSVFKAVDDISLEIPAGEFVTLLGPSGCGKTTTLRMIAGFELPSSGEILLGEQKINHLPPDKRDTAMVFQSYALFPHYNVWENIAFGLKLKKLSETELNKKVADIIDLVGLQGLEKRFPNQISGGQQQRVALARALVMEPGVLLFDEPLSNLDAKLRVYMRTEIRKIQRRLGVTSIYVTHDQAEAMSLSDRIIVMNNGIIEQIGTPQEIYQKPISEFVADFIGRANFFNAVVKQVTTEYEVITFFGKDLLIPLNTHKNHKVGDAVRIVVRPESISIGGQGQFEGKVMISTFMGSYQEYVVAIGDSICGIEENIQQGAPTYKEGDSVRVHIVEANIHAI